MGIKVELSRLVEMSNGRLIWTPYPDVLRLDEPHMPKSARQAAVVKQELLQLLIRSFPYAAIWIDPNDLDVAGLHRIPAFSHRLTAHSPWITLMPGEVTQLIAELSVGGWGLFFSVTDSLAKEGPGQLHVNEAHLRHFTTELGASASVISWPDDVEWLICVVDGTNLAGAAAL